MPEIWLNYGTTDVVLDIRAENLGMLVEPHDAPLGAEGIAERIGSLDTSAPIELVVQSLSKAVGDTMGAIFALCESRSAPFPKVYAERDLVGHVTAMLPEGAAATEFEHGGQIRGKLAFIGDAELDGLFGYETVATRLLRQFGGDAMHTAYTQRNSNEPQPGRDTPCMNHAKTFASQFDIMGIEVIGGNTGVRDIAIGNPAETVAITSALAKHDKGESHRAMILSPGNLTSSSTLSRALHSLWNCVGTVSEGGIVVLLAECGRGIGSEALEKFIDGRMTVERTKRPPKYMNGMEDLLYLSEVWDRVAIALVSTLPEFYTKKLHMSSIDSAKFALEHILAKGPRQKVSVIQDAAHTLLN